MTNTMTVRARACLRPAADQRLHQFRPFADMTIKNLCRWCFGWYDDPRHT